MKSAIRDLAQFSDARLFDEIAEGISRIVENAENLDNAASCLIDNGNNGVARVLASLAAEEAAKVLVLIDVVRCPRNQSDAQGRTLGYFHSHLVKRLYAKLCSWYFADFKEMKGVVELECKKFYLDGPNNVDWIFPNALNKEREERTYVDYVKDVTTEHGPYFWHSPPPSDVYLGEHIRPASINVAQALQQIGATTPSGLFVVADVWRKFVPGPETNTTELTEMKSDMLERLSNEGLLHDEDISVRHVLDRWPFPLWPLDIEISEVGLDDLRAKRKDTIHWFNETEAKREPPPGINRKTVEALSEAYSQFERDRDELIGRLLPKNDRFRSAGLDVYSKKKEPDSYKRLKRMVLELADAERADLLALARYADPDVLDWPGTFKRAHEQISEISHEYQIGHGSQWLIGLERWERKPREFVPGG